VNPFSLDGRVAVVTGACGKLGPVWMEALLDAGARVAALDLAAADTSALYERVSERFGDALRRFTCDVTDRASIEAAAHRVAETLGEPSVLVNNAGIDQPPDSPGGRVHLHQLPIDQFRRMVEVNLLGTFQVTQVFGERMAARGEGSIINIGSLYASVRRLEGGRGEPVEVPGHALGATRGAGQHTLPWRRPRRPGRAVQDEVRCARSAAAHGRGEGPGRAVGVPRVARLVLCDRS
jgi:NAD(P)-dependent dehydrogenase (short-subunit alcohol dehydrogenase family)